MSKQNEQPKLYASSFKRLVAVTLDSLLLGIFFWTLNQFAPDTVEGRRMWSALWILISFAYFAGFEASTKHATPGKMALGMQVRRGNGRPLDASRALLRVFMYMLPTLPITVFSLSDKVIKHTMKVESLAGSNPKGLIEYALSPEAAAATDGMGLYSAIAGLGMLFFYCLPILFTRKKSGLHDAVSDSYVYRNKALDMLRAQRQQSPDRGTLPPVEDDGLPGEEQEPA